MKAKKTPEQQQQPLMMPVVAPKQDWVINCNKCGAALNVKNDGNAYICPVCGALLRIQTGTRIVKEIAPKEKKVHLTLTEKAVTMISEKEAKRQRKAAKRKKPLSKRQQKRAQKKLQRALETVVAQNVRLGDYDTGDVLFVDLEKEGLTIKKSDE